MVRELLQFVFYVGGHFDQELAQVDVSKPVANARSLPLDSNEVRRT